MVRALLNGRFTNTSFCVFDPQGRQRLSKAGRSPSDLVPGHGGEADDDAIIQAMNRIAARYRPKQADEQAVLQDFDSFRQALNVASADQRLLVFVTSADEALAANLQRVLFDETQIGKFHLDFGDAKTDQEWAENIRGVDDRARLFIIRADQFGTSGVVMGQLAENATSKVIAKTLTNCNKQFASVEQRKTYSDHVKQGRRQGVYFENAIPYGEDRDGDGQIDKQGRQSKMRAR